MKRRPLLVSLGVVSSTAVTGCLDRIEGVVPDDEPEDENSGETTESRDGTTESRDGTTDSTIMLIIDNNATDARSVQLTLSTDEEAVFEQTVQVDADSRARVDPDITETGQYELRVATDESETTFPFSVDGYDLEMGSNVIVEVSDGIRVMMEE